MIVQTVINVHMKKHHIPTCQWSGYR